jgi:hypothetical protein
MWKVDNKSRNWVQSLPAVALAMNSTMHTITRKTPLQIVFRDPIFNVPLLPPGKRSTALVMDEDGSIFAGANEDTRHREELLPLSCHFSASVDPIEAWLNGVGSSEMSINTNSRRAMSASHMSVTVAASEEQQMPTHDSKCQRERSYLFILTGCSFPRSRSIRTNQNSFCTKHISIMWLWM